jgi:hypothetical protein
VYNVIWLPNSSLKDCVAIFTVSLLSLGSACGESITSFALVAVFFFAFLLLSLLLGSRVNPCMFSKKLFDFSSFHIYSCFFNCYLFYFILSIGLEFSFNLILIWFFSPFRHGSHSFDFDFLIIFLIKLSFNCIPQYFISLS